MQHSTDPNSPILSIAEMKANRIKSLKEDAGWAYFCVKRCYPKYTHSDGARSVAKAYENIRYLGAGVLAYKRCHPALFGWLERAQARLGAYGPTGDARKRDREAYEAD